MPDSHLEMDYEDRTYLPDDDWDNFESEPQHECDLCQICEICGEDMCTNDPRPSRSEIGEFAIYNFDPVADPCGHGDVEEHVIAHAECGLNAGYPLA